MPTRIPNEEIVKLLKEALAAMEIKGDNRFAIRAYQNAIASIDNLTSSVFDMWENNRLREISGVGGALEQHLGELFETGKVAEWVAKKKDLPDGMFELLILRGVGPKTAFKLSKQFKINDREDALKIIKKAAKAGKIQELPGFGEKSEKDILDSIEDLKHSKSEKQRMLLSHAEEIAGRVVTYLREHDKVVDAQALGSLRRRASTVGDIDIAVSSDSPKEVIDYFVKFPEIKDIESQGDRMSTVILSVGAQVDILVSAVDSYGSMLQHFTGSKQHNIKLRQHALEQGMSLSQYGVKEGKKGEKKLNKFSNEKDFYKHLGLEWVPPELREGQDEINLAQSGKLPKLIEVSDIKGDLHVHTTDSDGTNTLEEMVTAARELGYEYLGNADHAPSVQSRGKYEVLGIIDKKRMQIERLNEKYDDIKILYGYEVNILKDKTLGMPDELLEKLDYVIAGIHTAFDSDRELATERLLSAIRNPLVDIIAHPTGRLINERNSLDIDWNKVFAEVIKHNKILEINSHPTRLDLPDHLVRDALKEGIKIVINTDAHSTSDLHLMKYGIDVARRGGCTAKDVLNTDSKMYNLLSRNL